MQQIRLYSVILLFAACSKDDQGRFCGNVFSSISLLSNANGSVNAACMGDIQTNCDSECRETLQNVCYNEN